MKMDSIMHNNRINTKQNNGLILFLSLLFVDISGQTTAQKNKTCSEEKSSNLVTRKCCVTVGAVR